MDQRIKIIFFLLIYVSAFSINPEERSAEAMIEAKKYYQKKNWLGIIKTARKFYSWGEKNYVEKCLSMAEPIVAAKNSTSGALQIADLYKKIDNQKKHDYWIKVYQRLMEQKQKKWKKT